MHPCKIGMAFLHAAGVVCKPTRCHKVQMAKGQAAARPLHRSALDSGVAARRCHSALSLGTLDPPRAVAHDGTEATLADDVIASDDVAI